MRVKKALLINPWVYDCAYYDLWAKPLGLLYISAFLKKFGWKLELVDLTSFALASDRHPFPKRKKYGTGHVQRVRVPQPEQIERCSRKFYRYGIALEDFQHRLRQMAPPTVLLVTSLMTYWYPGVRATIKVLKKFFPGVPVILGGIYASIAPQHAREFSGADYVLPGHFDQKMVAEIYSISGLDLNHEIPSNSSFDFASYPAPLYHELYAKLDSAAVMSSWGCPYNCAVCASKLLSPEFAQKGIEQVVSEIIDIHEKTGVTDFAFYDDALLYNKNRHFIPMMKALNCRVKLNYHVPNGLHVSDIDRATAELLYESNFKEIRLGFEGLANREVFDKQISNARLEEVVADLKAVGYSDSEIRVYILVGTPDQDPTEIIESMYFAHRLGLRVELAYYSPIPGTTAFDSHMQAFGLLDDADLLWHNCSLWEYRLDADWTRKLVSLKRRMNRAHKRGRVLPDR